MIAISQIAGVLLVVGIATHLTFRCVRRQFIKRMSTQEKYILETVGESSLSEYDRQSLKELATEYQKINPQGGYLRPSAEPQDDTLLRAATSPSTTPQEQLLRPSQTEE